MPATSLDIVSVEEIKQELDLPQTHTSEDAKLERQIAQAVDTTARVTGRSLLDKPVKVYGEIPVGNGNKPLVFFKRGLRYLEADVIKYWQTNQTLADDPGGVIDDIGRFILQQDGLVVYRTKDWPDDVAPKTKAVLNTRIGAEAIEPGLKSAIIILIRHLYGGFEKLPMSYGDLVAPYRIVTPEEQR